MTLFLRANARDAEQLAALTGALARRRPVPGCRCSSGPTRRAASSSGLGHDTTRFPGAMALGAADDEALTEAVGRGHRGWSCAPSASPSAYAPVCDLAVSPGQRQPGHARLRLGPRGRGAPRGRVRARPWSGGVVATPKHFPGFGAVDADPHYRLGVLEADRASLEARELVPFRAALAAGAGMVMSAHVALPALTGDRALPATVSRDVMVGLLRGDLGFAGVSITDAMDMKAVAQGSAGVVDSIVALRAGVDLLLLTPDRASQRRLEAGLRQAALRGLIPAAGLRASRARIMRLRRWLAGFGRPTIDVVRSGEHRALARRAGGRGHHARPRRGRPAAPAPAPRGPRRRHHPARPGT